jgi:hypothetical protein
MAIAACMNTMANSASQVAARRQCKQVLMGPV